MCGICGVAEPGGRPADGAVVLEMASRLAHRGPDDRGVAVAGGVALGQTRLSIIDLSEAGHQPMSSPDGRVTLVYNGEVYNHRELRARLEARGAAFHGRSDTEVVLAAYLAWGLDALPLLDGMFALAVWDARSGELHLARDRFGIKPLYYRAEGGSLAFGSEIKAVLAAGAPPEVHWEGLHEYLWYGNALGENTLFRGIRRVPPGHRLTWGPGGLRVAPFWRLEDAAPVEDGVEAATARVRERLEAAVRSHLVSDVPVGVFLSGGIDSSAITAFASRHHEGPLKTFSVGFDFDRGVDELPRARRVARHFGTDHREIHVAGADIRGTVERLVRCHDEPFGDAANIPLYLLCEQLGGEVKVVLQGDGGDELFAGYRRYEILARERSWRAAAALGAPVLAAAPAGPRRDRGLRFLDSLRPADPALRMALLLTVETPRRSPLRVLAAAARERLRDSDPFRAYREAHARFRGLDPVQRMLLTDLSVLLPNTFLEKVDKSTMAHSVEVRVPFLDNSLAAYAVGLPSSYKVRGGEKKWILRRALRGVVPDEVLDGPKTGFGVPYEYWLRAPLAGFMREVLTDPATTRWGIFDARVLAACMDDHVSGRRNHGFLLWKCLHLALWHRAYFDGR